MVKVTLDVFSGMPNPSWILSEKDTEELVNRFAGKAMPSIEAVEGVLGFRSFIIGVVAAIFFERKLFM